MSSPRTVRLSPNDNVVVAVDPIAEGASAAGVTARARVMRGHKMAVAPIAQGEPVRKYDQIIGFATQPIAPGDWVHTHNVEMHDFARDYRFAEGAQERRGAAAGTARDVRGLSCGRAARPARATISASSPR